MYWDERDEIILNVMYISLITLSVLSLAAQILGIFILNDTFLLIQKIGFYVSIAAVVGVIAMYIIDKAELLNEFLEDHVALTVVTTILGVAVLAMSCVTLFSGWLGIKSFYIDRINGVTYAEQKTEFVVWDIDEGYENVVIQSSYGGIHVGQVRKNAAKNLFSLQTVEFSDGDMIIQKGAFKNCSRLTEIKFGSNSNYEIAKSAFAGCRMLASVDCGEGSYLRIAYKAFEDCLNLENFYVRSSNVEIYDPSDGWELDYIVFGNNKVVIHVDGGSYSELHENVGGLVIGNKSSLEMNDVRVGKVVFQDGFDFDQSKLNNKQWEGNAFSGEFHPCCFGDVIYLPASITYIPDNFFGEVGNGCVVHFAGTQEQWDSLAIGKNGNSNYTSGKVTVECNSPYAD